MEENSSLLTKEDWETYRKGLINHLKNVSIDKTNFERLLKLTDETISEFKDEVDKIVDEVMDGSN